MGLRAPLSNLLECAYFTALERENSRVNGNL